MGSCTMVSRGRCPGNPIEQVFAKLKNVVRGAAPCDVETLWHTIRNSLDRFAPAECTYCIAHSGYPRMM